MVFAIELGVAMILSIPITYIIIHVHATSDKRVLFGDKSQSNEDDNPLLLTIQAMEGELDELLENNRHMERIQRLEKQIQEARKHAEALSKIAGEYGSTMEEVADSMAEISERVNGDTVTVSHKPPSVVGGVGNRDKTYHYYSDGSVKVDNELQNLVAKLDKSMHRAEYGQWNTIPTALSHEERVNTAMEKLSTKRMKEGY